MKRRRTQQSRPVTGAALIPDVFATSTESPSRAQLRGRYARGMAVALVYIAAALLPLMMVGIASTNVAVKAWDSLPVEVPDVNAVAQHSQLLDRNGKVFATFATTNRVPIKRNDLPDSMVNAIVSVEDADFFQHAGVDLKSIARAVFNNASGGSTQGGSTITQQWVKNVLANTATTDTAVQAAVERSWERKLREAKLALTADGGAFTKDDILTSYLNTAYFGDQAYGIFAAAKHYYSRHPRDLSLNQAAMLAGLVKSPSSLAPTQHKKAAIERRNTVLQRMQAEGYISEEKLAKEQARPIRLRLSQPDSGCINSRFPHYCSYTKAALLRDPVLGDTPERRQDVFDRGGLQVTTALDPTAQKASIDAARNHVGTSGDVAAAIAVVRPGTTEVVAAATNREFGKGDDQTEITYANTSLAPLGSNFKPFVLGTALERGFSLSTTFSTPDGYYPRGMHAPVGGFHNANRSSNGTLDARGATKGSVNTWFIQLIERVGTKPVADFAERVGITTLPRKGPSRITDQDATLALGNYNAKPIDVATGYATFAADGTTCDPTPILKVRMVDGSKVKIRKADRCRQGTSAAVAHTVANILTAPFEAGGTASSLGLPDERPTAGKTGTTDSSAATWFTGFTPQYVTSVWVGDPRGGFAYPLRNRWINGSFYGSVYGATIAGPIWQEVMTGLHEGLPIKGLPGVDTTTVTSSIPAVPDLKGLSSAAAVAAAERAGFTKVKTKSASVGDHPQSVAGLVVKQKPAPGTGIPVVARHRITLTVVE